MSGHLRGINPQDEDPKLLTKLLKCGNDQLANVPIATFFMAVSLLHFYVWFGHNVLLLHFYVSYCHSDHFCHKRDIVWQYPSVGS